MLIPPPSKSEYDYGDDETEENDGTDNGITGHDNITSAPIKTKRKILRGKGTDYFFDK